MRLFGRTDFDFLALRWPAAGLSLLIIAIGCAAMLVGDGLRMGIDFAGGSQLIVRFGAPPQLDAVRAALTEHGFGSAQVQEFGDADEILIRTPATEDDSGLADLALALDALGSHEVVSTEWVGPQVGADLRRQAFQAIVWSLLGMLAYMSYRFELKYGVAAVVALFHDVLITLGAFALAGRELNLPVVAALLTIVGYSLNDTVVIFDRIRENKQTLPRLPVYERINLSVNQTLSRTVLTSLTTLLVVIALFAFGGPMINDFAFTLLIGIIAGTYSTVFIANPIAYYWETAAAARRHRGPEARSGRGGRGARGRGTSGPAGRGRAASTA
jgi:preprotein translocase SecF subunit